MGYHAQRIASRLRATPSPWDINQVRVGAEDGWAAGGVGDEGLGVDGGEREQPAPRERLGLGPQRGEVERVAHRARRDAVLPGGRRQRWHGKVERGGCERALRVHSHGRRARWRLKYRLGAAVDPAGLQRFAVALQAEDAVRVAAAGLS